MLLLTSTVPAFTEHRGGGGGRERGETGTDRVSEGKINQEIESTGPGEPEPASNRWKTHRRT